MRILIQSDDEQLIQNIQAELRELVICHGLQGTLQAGAVIPQMPAESHRGDPVTIYTVLLAALSAGGALTVAMSKDGFLTQLARVLEKYIESGKTHIIIKDSGRELEMKGSARRIEKMLAGVIEHIKH